MASHPITGSIRIAFAGSLWKRDGIEPAPRNYSELVAFVEIDGTDELHTFRTPLSEILAEVVEHYADYVDRTSMADALEKLAFDVGVTAQKLRGRA